MKTRNLMKNLGVVLITTCLFCWGIARANTTIQSSIFKCVNTHPNCSTVMEDDHFDVELKIIAKKYFDETRIALSKDLLDNHCLSSDQVRQLLGCLSYDKTRRELVKYAFPRVSDPENFSDCRYAFAVPASAKIIDDLMEGMYVNTSR